MEGCFHPPEYRLPWVPVADHGVNVGVDQSRRRSRPIRVDDEGEAVDVEVRSRTDRIDASPSNGDRITVGAGVLDVAGRDGAEIEDQRVHSREETPSFCDLKRPVAGSETRRRSFLV